MLEAYVLLQELAASEGSNQARSIPSSASGGRVMSAKTRRRLSSTEGKSVVMGAALLITGVFEFLEGMEEGTSPVKSLARAYRRTAVRVKAVKKAAAAAAVEIRNLSDDSKD